MFLKQAKPYLPEHVYSSTMSYRTLAKEMGLGSFLDVFIVDSKPGFLPYGIATVFATTLYGREFSFLEVKDLSPSLKLSIIKQS